MRGINTWVLALLSLILASCASSRPYIAEEGQISTVRPPDTEIAYKVYLIGDVSPVTAGHTSKALDLLISQLDLEDERSAIVFLGAGSDCCNDTSLDTTPDILEALQAFRGRVVFIPDEEVWKRDGLAARIEWQQRLDSLLQRDDAVLPADGFPGPKPIELNDWLTLITLDTQWWLESNDKSFGEANGYNLNEEEDFLLEINNLLQKERKKSLLVVGHHPIHSNGEYAGYFSLHDHLFPLRSISPALWIPAPVIGSVMPLYSRYAGRSRQDLSHPQYTKLREALTRIFYQHNGLIYASAHENNLQYFRMGPIRNQQHFLISGSANKTSHVGAGRSASFTAELPGYMQLTYYEDGAAWLDVWGIPEEAPNGKILYSSALNGPMPERVDVQVAEDLPSIEFKDSTITAAINPSYTVGPIRRFFYGKYYRTTWTQPVVTPFLDLGKEAGGLQLLKRGGGMQTSSLHFQDRDSLKYVLRSIEKTTLYTVPDALRGTIVSDVVDDVMASLHPYGALLVPPLAEAAGIYHAHPKVVYVPDDPRLGIYRDKFAGRIMMFENRPDDDMSDDACVGHARNVVSFETLYRKIEDDNDHRIDQHAFARARLFDMLIADWDRNPKQWRWAAFEPYELDSTLLGEARTMGKIYRPVPRDRDWAFSRLDGVIPSLVKIVLPKFQGFEYNYGDLMGLTRKGNSQDRRFTAELTRENWIDIATQLRDALSDEVIENAIDTWPEAIQELDGAAFADILKARRDQLPEIADKYYRLNARMVDIVGSNKHERFEVDRIDRDTTRVRVYKTTKEGEIRQLIYQRTFVGNDTREIRLHGMDGTDRFILKGAGKTSILVRAVGGPGEDLFIDETEQRGRQKTAVWYISEDDEFAARSRHTNIRRVDDPIIHNYEALPFRYDRNRPIVLLGSDRNDGFFFGGGIEFINNGFKREPYATSHKIRASYAPLHGAIDAAYSSRYVTLLGRWHIGLDATYSSLEHLHNFYGFGNETSERDRYRFNLGQVNLAPSITRMMKGNATFSVAPQFSWTRIDLRSDESDASIPQDLIPYAFDDQWLAGLELGISLDNRDQARIPRRGFVWNNALSAHAGLSGEDDSYGTVSSDLSLYMTPVRAPWLTFAYHVAGAHNVGHYPFYLANALGINNKLLGYSNSRFIGRTSLFHSLELRARVFRYTTYLAPGEAGLLAAVDHGRVWADGETSRTWHAGYGVGPWLSFIDAVVISGTFGYSEEGTSFDLRLGYRY